MSNSNNQCNNDHSRSLEVLLNTEYQNLVHWLHDELGQNLVAIRSLSAAIMEQNKDATDDTAELAEMISQAADMSYRAAYDLMQELRAQNNAQQPIGTALATCIEDARLKEKNIEHRLQVDSGLDRLDEFTKAVILRSTRTFINYSKLCCEFPNMSIGLHHPKPGDAEQQLKLQLLHEGEVGLSPEDAGELQALRKRIEAIDGGMQLETNNKDYFKIDLHLGPQSI